MAHGVQKTSTMPSVRAFFVDCWGLAVEAAECCVKQSGLLMVSRVWDGWLVLGYIWHWAQTQNAESAV